MLRGSQFKVNWQASDVVTKKPKTTTSVRLAVVPSKPKTTGKDAGDYFALMKTVPNAAVRPQVIKPKLRSAILLRIKEEGDEDWRVLNSILISPNASPAMKQEYANELFMLRHRWSYANVFSGTAKFSVVSGKVWA